MVVDTIRSSTELHDMQMRAGTQTLIQALQAIPWEEDPDNDNDDDDDDGDNEPGRLPTRSHLHNRNDILDTVDSDSDEEDRTGTLLATYAISLFLEPSHDLSCLMKCIGQPMASSIHAIHRSVAFSRRQGSSQLGLHPPVTASSSGPSSTSPPLDSIRATNP